MTTYICFVHRNNRRIGVTIFFLRPVHIDHENQEPEFSRISHISAQCAVHQGGLVLRNGLERPVII